MTNTELIPTEDSMTSRALYGLHLLVVSAVLPARDRPAQQAEGRQYEHRLVQLIVPSTSHLLWFSRRERSVD